MLIGYNQTWSLHINKRKMFLPNYKTPLSRLRERGGGEGSRDLAKFQKAMTKHNHHGRLSALSQIMNSLSPGPSPARGRGELKAKAS